MTKRDGRSHLERQDANISRCPRCGAWRYRLVCTGACPVLLAVGNDRENGSDAPETEASQQP